MLRRALSASLVASSLLLAGAAHADHPIGVVDVQYAVMQTEDGIRAQATLKKLFDKRQQELDAKQKSLQKQREDIERQTRVLSREALGRRMESWQKQMLDLQTVFVEYNKELQKKQGELTAPIIKKMGAMIERLAKNDAFEVILDKQAAPYARQDLDLTDRVIQMYNSGGPVDSASGPTDKDKKPDAP